MKRLAVVLLSCFVFAAPAQAAPTLERGDRGKPVRVLQAKLGITADGVFGRQTVRALRRYQRRNGLPVTGRFDTPTRTALYRATPPASSGTGGVEAADTVLPAPGVASSDMVTAALSVLGAKYEAAAAGPDSFDCSGLVVWAAAQAGITGLPRSSFGQYEVGTPVAVEDIAAGDLVFFDTAGPGPSDVGIATGPDNVVSATTHGVREHPLAGPYWGKHFVGARRL